MHDLDLILTLTGALIAALIFGLITQRLGLSPIVGYLLAGIAVSPRTPGFVADKGLADQLAEIGVILLRFGVGLQFHFKELLAVRRIAIPGALGQSVAATLLGAVLMHLLGWNWQAGLVFGMALSVASTVVLTRVLVDNKALHTPTGHIAIGWLVVEDLLTVFVLVLLPALFAPGTGSSLVGIAAAAGMAVVKIGALIAFTFVVGGWLIPRLLGSIARSGSRELFTLAILALALGIAVGSAKVFGVSMALGAFLAGMVVGRSEFSLRAATEAMPMRDAFAVLFFVSVGMLFDFRSLLETPGLVLATLFVVLVGKPLVALILVLLRRYPLRTALSVAVALAQIGEFSFILASLGRQLYLLPESAANVLVAAAMVSITLNPLLFQAVGRMERFLRNTPALARWIPPETDPESPAGQPVAFPPHGAIVVGYGPVGQTVARLLSDQGITPVFIEMNLETVQRLRVDGVPVVYGDAGRIEVLEHAGVASAEVLILAASSLPQASEIVRQARSLNPGIGILARTAYLREATDLRASGANGVFSGEGEVALAMAEFILNRSRATPDLIQRERERVRQEFIRSTGAESRVDSRTPAS